MFQCHSSAWISNETVRNCNQCSKSFEVENELTRHVLEKHWTRTFCPCRGFWFNEEKFVEHFNNCYLLIWS